MWFQDMDAYPVNLVFHQRIAKSAAGKQKEKFLKIETTAELIFLVAGWY